MQSRALRTGSNFVLQTPTRALVQHLSWSSAHVEPGESIELRVACVGLKEPVELIIEREATDDLWEWAGTVEAQASGDGASARAQWTMPQSDDPQPAKAPDEDAEPGVTVDGLAFDDAPELTSDTAWVHARVAGLDGRQVQLVLERAEADGEFVEVGAATATVRDREIHAGISLR